MSPVLPGSEVGILSPFPDESTEGHGRGEEEARLVSKWLGRTVTWSQSLLHHRLQEGHGSREDTCPCTFRNDQETHRSPSVGGWRDGGPHGGTSVGNLTDKVVVTFFGVLSLSRTSVGSEEVGGVTIGWLSGVRLN